MTTVLALQRALQARGYEIGGADGLIGPRTVGAAVTAVNASPVVQAVAPVPVPPSPVIPADWMPWAQMSRIIIHWTAGNHKASAADRKHYHLLLEGDGKLVRGNPSIALNQAPAKVGYAAHTLNCNIGSIGVSLCGMSGAVARPFNAGKVPLTLQQWAALPSILAALCRRYSIPITPSTVLTHAEVQGTLGIAQRGKWDIAILPFDPTLNTAKKVGDSLRAAVSARL